MWDLMNVLLELSRFLYMGDPTDKHNEAVVIKKCLLLVSKNVPCAK